MKRSILLLLLCHYAMSCQRAVGLSTNNTTSVAHEYVKQSDLVWASPAGVDLKMDIYTPQTGKRKYPVILMFHGGGWLINDKRIMNDAAAYLASNGEYVVCNVDYRLLVDENNSVTMDEIIGDAFGALLWTREHIHQYKGDPNKIIVTGDSAGGHLAAILATQGGRLGQEDFQPPEYRFRPTYVPESGIPKKLEVQAAILSYGAFDLLQSAQALLETGANIFWQLAGARPRGIFGDQFNFREHSERYQRVSPYYLVETEQQRTYPPMLFTVGSKDGLTTPASIKRYLNKLRENGHKNLQYWIHEDRPHAFLDAGTNPVLGTEFTRDAVPALDYMLSYLDKLFY